MPAYDATNIFARILRGELPAHKVYEDENTLAFMDIMPRAEGHCLVIPKRPARGLLDADPADLAAVMATAQRVARAAMGVFGADGITIQQFNEEAGGQVVFHLHVHVLPRRSGEPLRPPGAMADGALLADHAARLAAALAESGRDEGLRPQELTTENDR